MNLLVTGGAGFIGSNFIEYILEHYPNYKIYNLDKLTYAGFRINITPFLKYPNYNFIWGDILNKWIVDPLVKECDLIVHFAAESNVDLSILNSDDFLQTNVIGTKVILESVKKYGVERLIIVSTDEVYGNTYENKLSKEDSPLLPCSPYAASKVGQDVLSYSYYVTYNLPIIITRGTNNYGPRQDPTKLIPRLILNAMYNKPLPIYGKGINTREWLYVKDHVKALDILLHSAPKYNGEIFNIGSGVELSSLEIAKLILQILNKPQELIEFVPDRKGHVLRHAVDCTKLKNEFKFCPSIDFETGLKQTIDWYLNNLEWCKFVVKQQSEMIINYSKIYGFDTLLKNE